MPGKYLLVSPSEHLDHPIDDQQLYDYPLKSDLHSEKHIKLIYINLIKTKFTCVLISFSLPYFFKRSFSAFLGLLGLFGSPLPPRHCHSVLATNKSSSEGEKHLHQQTKGNIKKKKQLTTK